MKKIIGMLLAGVLVLTLAACGNNNKTVDLGAMYNEMKTAGDFSQMMTLNAEAMQSLYGVEPSDVKAAYGAINETGIVADEIVLIEAASSEAAAKVKEKLNARYQAKLNEMDGYLPEQYAIVQKGEVAAVGNYVCLIVWKDNTMKDIYNKYFK